MKKQKMNVNFHLTKSPIDFDYDVYITADGPGDKCGVAEPVVFQESDPTRSHGPAMKLELDDLQRLFNELWRFGIRPKHLEDSASALGATRDHLNDMRRLVFKDGDGTGVVIRGPHE